MEIIGNEIIAAEGKWVYRKTDTRFETPIKRALLFTGETTDDFVEYDEVQAVIPLEEKPAIEAQMATFARMMTRTMRDIPDETAVEMPDCFDEWKGLIGQTLEKGRIISHSGKTYRLQQQHLVQAHFVPGAQGMESIYAVIDKKHAGTLEDPIPYNGNMALENGKYYTQDGSMYRCNRDTVIPVYDKLIDLVGIYVELIEQ